MLHFPLIFASFLFGNLEVEKRAYLFDAFPVREVSYSSHLIANVGFEGETIQFDDGSIWKVSPYDQRKAKSFGENITLTLTQNHRWFSRYSYRLVEKDSGICLEANLARSPSIESPMTFTLFSVDGDLGLLSLTRQSGTPIRFEVSRSDLGTFASWLPHQLILIGQNSGTETPYSAILINAVTNQSVQARELQ